MLSTDEMIILAQTECIKMLGEELVRENISRCCPCHSINCEEQFRFTLCMSIKDMPYKMGAETPFDYYATVMVSPETGIITRDYKNSILPNDLD